MPESNTCVLASSNKGKLIELSDALKVCAIQLEPQSRYEVTDADETAVTFIENALIKARHACTATGLPALADDSGLVVPALDGAPGIYSARYAQSDELPKPTDTDNINKLLAALKNHQGQQRQARFICVLAYLSHANDPEPVIATGSWHGQITDTLSGEGGFGYDPIFFCPKTRLTAAAMGAEKKRAISHRALAIKRLQQLLIERH